MTDQQWQRGDQAMLSGKVAKISDGIAILHLPGGNLVAMDLAELQPAGTTVTNWAVAYGCPSGDPNEAAGNFVFDDEGDARETGQWVTGGILARRTVTTGRWEAVSTDE